MTSRDRRALWMGGAIVVGAIVVLRVVPAALRTLSTAHEQLQIRAALLARARADLAQTTLLRDSAVELSRALVELAPKILSGTSAAEAVADLSGRVNRATVDHQAKLEGVDPASDSVVAGRLHRATVRTTFECDIRGLVGVIEALELGKAALAVRELRVTAVDPALSDGNPERLRVELVVTGWFLGGRDAGARNPGMPSL